MSQQQNQVKKNDIYDVLVEDLTHEGAGVAKVNGFTLFIPNTLPGERAKVKVIKVKKGYGYGRLLEHLEESASRTAPLCPIYSQCGGCQLQHVTYGEQLKQKRKMVENVMMRIGKISVPVHPTLGMSDPWRYRNKAQVPLANREGGLVTGFYKKGTHQIVEMEACLIQKEENDKVVQTVREIAEKYGITGYDEETHRGVLRHVVVRYGQVTGELMVVLVTKERDIPNLEFVIKEMKEQIPQLKSIVQNINTKRTNVIFGDKTVVCWGEEYIYDYIGEIKFAISARSFYQVNPQQTKVLYEKALEYAQLTGEETVIDAYCGIGTISLFLAQRAKHVYGVEIVPEAISDAKRNAKINGIENVTFAVGEAEKVIPWWYTQGAHADCIVVDPPRKGCDIELLETMIQMKPERIVYVSCNPATLARDLRVLEDGGYQTEEVQPVDMFPMTMHVECVASLVIKQ